MSSFVEWFKWFFWDRRVCPHNSSEWKLEDLGRKKVRWCDDCGAGLEVR